MLSLASKPLDAKLISILLPVYNEQHSVADAVQRLHNVAWPLPCEILAINDKSTDGSGTVLDKLALEGKVRVFHHEVNQGKGAALRTGMREAWGQVIAIQDADFEYDPSDLPKLIRPILAGDADVVYGSRFKKSVRQVHRTFHMMVNRFLTLLSNLLSGIYLSDMETCYKVFRADLVKSLRLTSNRFGFEVEVTAYIAKLPVRVLEYPIKYYPRNYRQGKKIGWRDGIAAVIHIIRFNWFTSARDCVDPKSEVAPYLFSPES